MKPMTVGITTIVTAENDVQQDLNIFGEITRRIAKVAAMQMDEKVREALINLGWTPPKE